MPTTPENDEHATFDVIIHDESDPVLAVVVPHNGDTPVFYRDFEAVYERPASDTTIELFAEWLVNRKFKYTTDTKRFDLVDLHTTSMDAELIHVVRVHLFKRQPGVKY